MKIGVIIPLPEQINTLNDKWNGFGFDTHFVSASTYASDDFIDPSKELTDKGVEIIVLDCMGYTLEHKTAVNEAGKLPVVLARSIVAKVASSELS